MTILYRSAPEESLFGIVLMHKITGDLALISSDQIETDLHYHGAHTRGSFNVIDPCNVHNGYFSLSKDFKILGWL